MLELLQFATSGFFTFVGCFMFASIAVMGTGWALNAVLIGLRGIKCDPVFNFSCKK